MTKSKKKSRLFFALDLEPVLKTQLLVFQDSLKESLRQVSDLKIILAVPPANFHITLCFLGDLSERQLDDIVHNFTHLSLKPFEISLGDLIYWQKSAILALSINDSENKLLQVKKEIEKKLSQIGIFSYDKKKFEPHITLFKQLDNSSQNNLFLQTQSNQLKHNHQKIIVDDISLMISTNSQNGVFYESLETWPLRNLSIKQQLLGK